MTGIESHFDVWTLESSPLVVERYSIKFPEWWGSDGCLSRPIFVQPDDSTEKKNQKIKTFTICIETVGHVTSNWWTKFTLVRQRDCGGSWKFHSEIELNWSALYLRSDILFSPVWHVNILGVHVNSKEMSASILEDQLSVLTIGIHYFNLIGPSIAQVKLVCWKLCLRLECKVSKYIPYCFNGFFL